MEAMIIEESLGHHLVGRTITPEEGRHSLMAGISDHRQRTDGVQLRIVDMAGAITMLLVTTTGVTIVLCLKKRMVLLHQEPGEGGLQTIVAATAALDPLKEGATLC